MKTSNAIIYVATAALNFTPDRLKTALAERKSRPCGDLEVSTSGFTAVHSDGSELVVECADGMLIRERYCERILPAPVVSEQVMARVSQIEAERGAPVYGKDRSSIKEDVLRELIPKALIRTTDTFAWIGTERVIVFTGSNKTAERITSTVRKLLGSLPIVQPAFKTSTVHTMTNWLLDNETLGHSFKLGSKATFAGVGEDGGTVSLSDELLTSDEVLNHLNHGGKQVIKVQLLWDNALVSVIVNASMQFKSIKVDPALLESVADTVTDDDGQTDAIALREAEWGLIVENYNLLITDLIEAFGGLDG